MPSRNKVVVGEPAAGEIVTFFAFAVSVCYKIRGLLIHLREKMHLMACSGLKTVKTQGLRKLKC